MTRRGFLAGMLGGAAYLAGRDRIASMATTLGGPRRPRYLVVLQLSGGPDAVLTLDPKQPSELETWVDNPLPRDAVEAGDLRFGAHFAPLAKWAPRMTVVQGVRVESVNHFSGSWQLVRMRRRVVQNVPGILDIIGHHRDTQPVPSITVGDVSDRGYTPGWIVEGFPFVPGQAPINQGFADLEALAADDAQALGAVLREHAGASGLRPADRTSYQNAAALVERLPTTTRFKLEDWAITGKSAKTFAPTVHGLQRVLWALENDLTATAFAFVTRNEWDTHVKNLERQGNTTGAFVQVFNRFLEELHARKNAFGSLAEQTTIVVSGELGRYPRLNTDNGKDHYPEMPMLFMGAGIDSGARGRMIGQTGKDMLAVPIDVATGKLGGNQHIMLDDVGTTLLRMFGVEPTRYGYMGRTIEPLLA